MHKDIIEMFEEYTPPIVIVSDGECLTHLYVNGEKINEGCIYVKYEHDVKNNPVLEIKCNDQKYAVEKIKEYKRMETENKFLTVVSDN